MKEQIKQVQNYFKNKLLNSDFKINKIESHTLELVVDEEYVFTIWIGNWDLKNCTKLYTHYNFMYIKFNQKEKFKLHSVLKNDVENYRKKVLYSEKLNELNKLKKELNLE